MICQQLFYQTYIGDASVEELEAFAANLQNQITQNKQSGDAALAAHVGNKANPHAVTKAQVGLANVDNTADADKSVKAAARLTTARTIALSGAVTGTPTPFDGSANIAIPVTTLDAGKLTGMAPLASIPPVPWNGVTGRPTSLAGYGITDAAAKIHAAQHAAGGSDPVAPAAIGALGLEHLSVADPHPQYLAKADGDTWLFFQFFTESGSMRVKAAIPSAAASSHLVVTATGIALKGAFQ